MNRIAPILGTSFLAMRVKKLTNMLPKTDKKSPNPNFSEIKRSEMFIIRIPEKTINTANISFLSRTSPKMKKASRLVTIGCNISGITAPATVVYLKEDIQKRKCIPRKKPADKIVRNSFKPLK